MLTIGKHVVEWVAKRTNEFGNFGTDIGIGWTRKREADTYCGYGVSDISGDIRVASVHGYGRLDTRTNEQFILDNLIAGVAYANWNGVNIECHIASDGSSKWLTRPYLWAIFDYPFCQLGVERITVCVGEGNINSRRFVVHLGFELETTLEAAHPTGNLLIFRMWKRNCRWISQEFSKRYARAA